MDPDTELTVPDDGDDLRWRVLVGALAQRLAIARADMMAAEVDLDIAIARVTKAREMCSSIADVIEAAARQVRR